MICFDFVRFFLLQIILTFSLSCVILTLLTNVSNIDLSTCNSNPCLNGATCYQGMDASYFCLCPEDYVGEMCETGS